MPYRTNSELPKGVKGALPEKAQSIFRNAFNSAKAKGASEERAMRIAWGAVKNAGYHNGPEGWVKKGRVNFDIEILEKSEDQQLVFGWLYVTKDRLGSDIVDHSGETIDIYELEKAVHNYVLKSRDVSENHQRRGVGQIVSSIVFTPELKKAMGIPPGILPDGAFIGLKITDAQAWEGVKSGKYKMFSLGGRAIRRALEESA